MVQFPSDEKAQFSSPPTPTSEELRDEDLDSSGTLSDVLIEQLYEECIESPSEVILQHDQKWHLLSPRTTTNDEPRDEDLDSSGTFSDMPVEQLYDEAMKWLHLRHDENCHLLPPLATTNEEGTLFSGLSTEQSHDQNMESTELLNSLFSGLDLQHDEDCGITALSPPPNRRTGPPDEDRTALDEHSLARVDTGLSTEHQQRPLRLRRVTEMVSPRFLDTVGRQLRVPILTAEMHATTNIHHPPSMGIHLMSDIDTPCNIWLQGPGKNNISEDPVVIHGKYLDTVIVRGHGCTGRVAEPKDPEGKSIET
ncbi:hypothetical protein F5883DRAFT_651303 [Diaporthe sp. PMI_573]|nr:hypothetical protein F5883DRAFT_651303 [Diaporthaceae sp. PMI_573]